MKALRNRVLAPLRRRCPTWRGPFDSTLPWRDVGALRRGGCRCGLLCLLLCDGDGGIRGLAVRRRNRTPRHADARRGRDARPDRRRGAQRGVRGGAGGRAAGAAWTSPTSRPSHRRARAPRRPSSAPPQITSRSSAARRPIRLAVAWSRSRPRSTTATSSSPPGTRGPACRPMTASRGRARSCSIRRPTRRPGTRSAATRSPTRSTAATTR